LRHCAVSWSLLAASALLSASCGGAFTDASTDTDAGATDDRAEASSPTPDSATRDAASAGDAPDSAAVVVNPNATITCSDQHCEPGPEVCCVQNDKTLNDFCVGGPGQPARCASDKATVTVLECDDGEDCVKAGHPGTVCCAQARTFDIDPSMPVWASVRCLPPASCLGADDDVFCGTKQSDCPAGKKCTRPLGPYTYCE
jgi:hypothetical protein